MTADITGRCMAVWLSSANAPNRQHMCTELEPCSSFQSTDIYSQANLENYPLADPKCTLNST